MTIICAWYRLPLWTALTLCVSRRSVLGEASVPSLLATLQASGLGKDPSNASTFRVVQVQLVHRHGDRTPITPMADEAYWAATLPQDEIVQQAASGTSILRDGDAAYHAAGGQGPFGKLTQLGLLQMVELGTTLRLRLQADADNVHEEDEHGNVCLHKGCLFTPSNPIQPSHVKVMSTDFSRTILSVQGTLIGLFPKLPENIDIVIDVRHASMMIPDPQPRRSKEQEELEAMLATKLQERETEMLPLAIRTTESLQPLLGKGAFGISFGVGEETKDMTTTKPLAWAQLAEITKCLAVRGLLPQSISTEDHDAIAAHTAWRWFQLLRHPRLAFVAMNSMVSTMVDSMHTMVTEEKKTSPVILYSAHDSTMIGLLCAFRLEQPSVWPEYGSYLTMELIEAVKKNGEKQHFVRFALNGNVLRSQWGEEEPCEVISLDQLAEYIKVDGL